MGFQNYFIYRGQAYGIGTKVKFKPTVQFSIITPFASSYRNEAEIKNQIYTFKNGTTDKNYLFWWYETIDPWEQQHLSRSQATTRSPDDDILEIVEPVYVELIPWQQKAIQNMSDKNVCADVFGGVLTYIVIMALAMIFKDRLVIWIVSTGIFMWWLLNQYRT
jgi:hypothetical protein